MPSFVSSSMLKAVIFDMDGVIADTEKLHAQTSAELLREFGILIENLAFEIFLGSKTPHFSAHARFTQTL